MAGNIHDVTTTATSGMGSLEQALTNAVSGDTIRFIAGGTFNLDKSYALNGAITFDLDGQNPTIGSNALTDPMGGQGSLTLIDGNPPSSGTDTLTLEAAETYTGATTIQAGTLALGGGGSVSDSSVVNVAQGAIFDVSFDFSIPSATSVNALSGSGTVATTSMSGKGATALSLTGDGTTTFAGAITGSGSLIENSAAGTGVQVLSGDNTYTGGTTFQAGTLSVSADDNLGNASGRLTFTGGTLEVTGNGFTSARAATLNGTGTVQVDTGALTLTRALSDGMNAGALTKTGAGTLVLTNAETYTGATTIAAGTLGLRNNDDVNTIGSLSGAIVDDATLRLSEYGNGSTVPVSNAISGSGGIVAASGEDQGYGGGVITLSGVNTYTGATLVEYGTLQGGVKNAFGTNSAVTLTAVNYGEAVLDLGGFDQAIGSLAGGISDQGQVITGLVTNDGGKDATLTVGGDATTTEFDGAIEDGPSKVALDKVGSGKLTLGISDAIEYSEFGRTNTYSGTTTVSAGILDLATNAAISANTTFAFVAPGATLELDQAPPTSETTGNATLANAISAFGPGDKLDLRDLDFNGGTATLSGSTLQVVSGGVEQDFTLSNPGTTLFAVSSDGPTNGTLVTAYALPTISGTVANQGTTGTTPVSPFSTATVGDPNAGTDTLTIALSGGGGTLKDGTGFAGPSTLQQTGANTYQLTGSAAAVTAELRALSFTPAGTGAAGSSTATTFTLTDQSDAAAAAVASDNTTTVVDAIPPAPAPTSPAPAPTNPAPAPTTPAPAPTTPAPAPASPPPLAPAAVSVSQGVSYRDGAFRIAGTASAGAGVRGVEITATVDGVSTDLGAAAVNADGSFTFQDRIGAHTQGFITATVTDSAGGTASAQAGYALTGGKSGSYKAEQDRYSADGSSVTATDLFKANGSQKADLMAAGQTFSSASFDTFDNGGQPSSTFVFDPGYGRDVVSLFRVDGTDHDTLSFKGSDYGNSIAAVLNAARDTKAGLLITDPTASSPGGGPGTHDTLLLKGINKAQLAQYQSQDITFHA